MSTTTIAQPATEAQRVFIQKLAKEQGTVQPTAEQMESWTKAKASEIIDWYLARQDQVDAQARAAAPSIAIPDGRYALQIEGDKNEWSFFEVRSPETGKWAGFTFVDQIASSNEWPVKGARKAKVLASIATDVHGALAAYGQHTEHCGLCNRPLHNDESKARGIGPICLEKL